MLHFHVAHLAGLFKRSSGAAVRDRSAVVVPLVLTQQCMMTDPCCCPLAATNTKWHWRENGDSYRSSKDRDMCHTPSPSAHCLFTMHWKFALSSWWLQNCPQLESEQQLSENASNPPTAVCLQESWQQNSSLTSNSKAFVQLLSRVSCVCQVSLAERPGNCNNHLVSLKQVHHPRAQPNSAGTKCKIISQAGGSGKCFKKWYYLKATTRSLQEFPFF